MTVVLAVPGCDHHARTLAGRLDARLVTPLVHTFPDGEMKVRIADAVFGEDVAIVANLYPRPAEQFLQIAFLAACARELGARRVGLVAPYLAFMRQDTSFEHGDGVSARYFAQLVSRSVDWLVTVDPHLHRIHSLDRLYAIPTTIARAASAIAAWIRGRTGIGQPILIGPDAESEQWVEAVAAIAEAPYVILEKTRRGDRDVSVSAPVPPSGRWDGYTPVVIDDIISTGRTMIEATRELRAAGSAAPICIAIHAVFADSVQSDLVAAGAQSVVTCDTIAHATNTISLGDALVEAVRAQLA